MEIRLISAALALFAAACAVPFAKKEKKMAGSIWSLSDEQLAKAQAKITYLGPQSKPVFTVVFGVAGHQPSMVRFLSVQHSSKPYDNDELPYTKTFSVSVAEFRRILHDVRPVVTSLSAKEEAVLSFAALTGAGAAVVGEEFLIPYSHGHQFYNALIGALDPANKQAKSIVEAQAKNLYQ